MSFLDVDASNCKSWEELDDQLCAPVVSLPAQGGGCGENS